MFTLKLYKHTPDRRVVTRILQVDRVDTIQLGEKTLELRAHRDPQHDYGYKEFYVGERKPEWNAINDGNHWEWGLLENAAGKTTQHFRPYTYDATGG